MKTSESESFANCVIGESAAAIAWLRTSDGLKEGWEIAEEDSREESKPSKLMVDDAAGDRLRITTAIVRTRGVMDSWRNMSDADANRIESSTSCETKREKGRCDVADWIRPVTKSRVFPEEGRREGQCDLPVCVWLARP